MVLAKAPKSPLGSHMPINPIQRTHTQILHASLRLHVLLVLVLMPPLLYFPMHRCQCRTQTIMALHQLPTRFTHTQTGCICTRIQTTQHACTLFSFSRILVLALFACAAPSPLSRARRQLPSVAVHLPPSALSCSPASHPPHIKLESLARCTPKMRALQDGRRLGQRQRCERRRCCWVPDTCTLPALAGTWVHATTASIRTPPSRSYCFAFSPFRRPPGKQPIRAPAQVPAGYSYTHGPSAWMGLGRTLKSLSHRPFAVGPSAPGPLSPAEMRAALSKVAAQHAQH